MTTIPAITAPTIIPTLSSFLGGTTGSTISYSSNSQRESSPFSIPVIIYLLSLDTSTTKIGAMSSTV